MPEENIDRYIDEVNAMATREKYFLQSSSVSDSFIIANPQTSPEDSPTAVRNRKNTKAGKSEYFNAINWKIAPIMDINIPYFIPRVRPILFDI